LLSFAEGADACQIYDPVQVFEAALFQDSRFHVVLEVPVVEWNPDAVETQRGKELGVGFSKEV
jgi:hypothetical protein